VLRSERQATHRGLGISTMLASRGCHYDCSFCSIHQFYGESPGPRRRTRSPDNVASEMERLFRDRGVRLFIFEDDDLFMRGHRQRQWINDWVWALRDRGIADRILWRVSCRVDDIDAQPIARMMEAGLISVYLGIEAGNAEGLRVFNKHYSVQDVLLALGTLRELDMPFEFGFMILHPESTFESIREDIDFLKEIGHDGSANVTFTKTMPYAGTALAHRLAQEGRLKGSVAAPDYGYRDPRLELLQIFFSSAFHFRNFHEEGLSERLRMAKFDALVTHKFFSDSYDTLAYREAVGELIQRSNQLALETMSVGVRFMAARTEEQILANWPLVQHLVRQEKAGEAQLSAALDRLLAHYAFA
jgi:radical SAM superfamily enzyme YgiQ (UPF0313 family)